MSYHIDSNDASFQLPPEAVGGVGAYHIDSNNKSFRLPPEAVGEDPPSSGMKPIHVGIAALVLASVYAVWKYESK